MSRTCFRGLLPDEIVIQVTWI